MKLRIISDLHVDINNDNCIYDETDNIHTIIVGDISNEVEITEKWLNETNLHGTFISGNHILYTLKNTPLSVSQNYFKTKFSKNNNKWVYLEKDYQIFENEKLIIFGATLWTDYKLGILSQEENLDNAKYLLNDFHYGFEDYNVNITSKYLLNEHTKTLQKLNDVCNLYKDYNIIVATHHCPSIKSSDTSYLNDYNTCLYISNLEDFILNHPNIKLWVHGHVHKYNFYNIGQCIIASNPKGYTRLFNQNLNWDINGLLFEVNKNGINLLNKGEK